MEEAGTVNGKSEVALLGMIEIFRRNTATGSVRQTAAFLESRAKVKRNEKLKAKANKGMSLRPVDSISIYLWEDPATESQIRGGTLIAEGRTERLARTCCVHLSCCPSLRFFPINYHSTRFRFIPLFFLDISV